MKNFSPGLLSFPGPPPAARPAPAFTGARPGLLSFPGPPPARPGLLSFPGLPALLGSRHPSVVGVGPAAVGHGFLALFSGLPSLA